MSIEQTTFSCDIAIKIYPRNEENFNTSLMETLCQNRELFRNLIEFNQFKTVFDYMIQYTVEKEANTNPSGKYVLMGR